MHNLIYFMMTSSCKAKLHSSAIQLTVIFLSFKIFYKCFEVSALCWVEFCVTADDHSLSYVLLILIALHQAHQFTKQNIEEFLVFVFVDRWNLQFCKETSFSWMIFKNQFLHPLESPVIFCSWRVWSNRTVPCLTN